MIALMSALDSATDLQISSVEFEFDPKRMSAMNSQAAAMCPLFRLHTRLWRRDEFTLVPERKAAEGFSGIPELLLFKYVAVIAGNYDHFKKM